MAVIPAGKMSNGAPPVGEALMRSVSTESRMTYSRLIGATFLAGFLLYGVGSAVATSTAGALSPRDTFR